MSGFFVAVQRLVRRWRCRHEWRFERGIYGDEINHVSLSKIYRSWWKCRLCGKRQPRPGLGAPNVAPHGRRDSDVPCRRLVGKLP